MTLAKYIEMDNDRQLILDYLAGDLPEAEVTVLEKRLQTDTTLAQILREEKERIAVLEAFRRAEVKGNIRQEFLKAKTKQTKTRRMIWSGVIAASVAVLLLFWLQPFSSEVNAEELAGQYAEVFILPADRGSEEVTTPEVDSLYLLYRQGEYEAALAGFEKLHQEQAKDQTILMCLGECFAQTGQYQAAAETFSLLDQQSKYFDVARWKTALNYVLAGRSDLALPVLKEISKGPHYQSDKAGTLIKSIEKVR